MTKGKEEGRVGSDRYLSFHRFVSFTERVCGLRVYRPKIKNPNYQLLYDMPSKFCWIYIAKGVGQSVMVTRKSILSRLHIELDAGL